MRWWVLMAPASALAVAMACGESSDAGSQPPPDAGGEADGAVADIGAADQAADSSDAGGDAPWDVVSEAALDSSALCAPASTEPCYDGPDGTLGVGACKAGVRVCDESGLAWSDCIGQVLPTPELCATLLDDDCDGSVNEEGADCACAPGELADCYSGPSGTAGIGICNIGQQVCAADGTGFGQCIGEVTPGIETCATAVDDDCDGQVNESGNACVCIPGSFEDCYTGPAGTVDVGACKHGARACNALGTALGPCLGEVVPTAELCSTPVDDDCDGQVNEEGSDCSCTPGATLPCYTGAAGTQGVGACHSGVQTCNASGTGFGQCMSEVTPTTENCSTPADEDCDAQPDCPGDVLWNVRIGSNYDDKVLADAWNKGSGGVDVLVHQDQSGVGPRTVYRFDENGNGLLAQKWNYGFNPEPTALGRSESYSVSGRAIAGSYGPTSKVLSVPGGSDLPYIPVISTNTGFFVAMYYNDQHVWSRGFVATGKVHQVKVGLVSGPVVVVAFTGTIDLGSGPLSSGSGMALLNAWFDSTDGTLLGAKVVASGALDPIRPLVEQSGTTVYGQSVGAVTLGSSTPPPQGGRDFFRFVIGSNASVAASSYWGGPGDDTLAAADPDTYLQLIDSNQAIDMGSGLLPAGLNVVRLWNTTVTWSKSYSQCEGEAVGHGTSSLTPFVVVATNCTSDVDFGGGVLPSGRYLVRFDAPGTFVWAHPLPGALHVERIASGAFGPTLIGTFTGTIDLGRGPLTSAGLADVVVARIVP